MLNNSDKIILDFCAGTGAWSEPYLQAGYDVRRYDLPDDIRLLKLPADRIYGILAAIPCTHLCYSGARWWDSKGEAELFAIDKNGKRVVITGFSRG